MFKRLFKEHGVKNVITLFHKPSLASSTRIHNLLKQQSAISSSTATQDQASNHYPQNNAERAKPFELEVTEASPTNDQLRSIIDFVGDEDVGKLVAGAHDWKSAQEQLTRDASNLQRPLVVDWNSGKAVVGENQSQILHLLHSTKKE